MRKKQGKVNHRKARFPLFHRRRRSGEESEWILLEADLSSPAARVRKGRTLVPWVVRVLGIACLCLSLPMAVKWTHNSFFYENDEFVLEDLRIRSDGSLSETVLSEVANVSTGMSLLDLELDLIRKRIEKLPSVAEVAVTREMPDTLHVEVRERVPVAWLSCPPLGVRPGDMERGFLLDGEGILFRCLDLTDEVRGLPVIEAFRVAEPKVGETLDLQGISNALDLVARAEELKDFPGMGIHVVRLRNEWSLECHYRSGLRVTYDLLEIERGIRDLAVILEKTRALPAPLETVNVAARENIPVTFAKPIDAEEISVIASPVEEAAGGPTASAEGAQEKHLRSILKSG